MASISRSFGESAAVREYSPPTAAAAVYLHFRFTDRKTLRGTNRDGKIRRIHTTPRVGFSDRDICQLKDGATVLYSKSDSESSFSGGICAS